MASHQNTFKNILSSVFILKPKLTNQKFSCKNEFININGYHENLIILIILYIMQWKLTPT